MTYLPPISYSNWTISQADCDPEYLRDYLRLENTPESKLIQAMFETEDETGVKDFAWDYKPAFMNTSYYKAHWKNYTCKFSYSNMSELYEPGRGQKLPKYDKRRKTNILRPPVMVSKLARILNMAKASAAVKYIRKELVNKKMRKVIIFNVNRDSILYMREYLRDLGAISIYSGMSLKKRERFVYKFRKYSCFRVLICNAEMGQTDIDGIQDACNNVIFVQPSWVTEENVKCIKLIHRVGQQQPVLVRFMSLAGTSDERVQEILKVRTDYQRQPSDSLFIH